MKASNPSQPLAQQLHQALRVYDAPEKLARLPLCHSPLVRYRQQSTPTETDVQTLQTLLDQQRIQLGKQHPLAADLLCGRFWEGLTVEKMVRMQRPEPQSMRRFYQQQEQAILLLAQVWEAAEQKTGAEQSKTENALAQRLPASTYTSFVGMEKLIQQIVDHLLSRAGPTVVALKGIGGIGKTATADHAVRTLLQHSHDFYDVIWISAKQEFLTQTGIKPHAREPSTRIRLAQIFDDLAEKLGLPEIVTLPVAQKVAQLAARLRAQPHLIIIDNLETVEDFQALVPWLGQLSDPSRFLLTSRETVPSLAYVVTVDLDELSQQDAMTLAAHIAHQKGVLDCDGAAVYELVGGNPLAIVLTVSLMRHLPPENVFDSMRSGANGDLYNYIFRQSWEIIGCAAQKLLFTIQRAGDVAEWEWLMLVTERPDTLQNALTKLMDVSLVYCQGGKNGQRCYAIHRLTSTFLRTEILGWK